MYCRAGEDLEFPHGAAQRFVERELNIELQFRADLALVRTDHDLGDIDSCVCHLNEVYVGHGHLRKDFLKSLSQALGQIL